MRQFETFRDISRHINLFSIFFRSIFDLSNRGLILYFFQIFLIFFSISEHIFCKRRFLIFNFNFWDTLFSKMIRHSLIHKIINFRPKIFLILYPSLENSTTHITIKCTLLWQQKSYFTPVSHYYYQVVVPR